MCENYSLKYMYWTKQMDSLGMKYNERTELTIEQNESFDQRMYGMSME